MKLIIFLIASLFIFTGLIGFINSPNNLNINIKHNPYPVNVNNSVSYIREFPINLNNVPSGTGYYQQLITIGNASYPYSNYNINSQGSNIQFISQNNTYLYAWIQNINTTTITIWIKNFNSSTTINMQVFPEFENLFSENGYLGEAPQLTSIYAQYDNGKNVFGINNYTDFSNLSNTKQFLNITADTSAYGFNNGLILPNGITSPFPNSNTIPSISTYNYGDFLGFNFKANLSTIAFMRIGYGMYTYLNNSYYDTIDSTSQLQTYINGGGGLSFGLITTPNMTYVNGYVAENLTGYPFTNFINQNVVSTQKITPITTKAFIQLNSGYSKFHYMFVATENGIMPIFTIGTGYYFLNITSIYTNTNTSISNNYFWNGHITDIECYVLPELNNQPIIPLNYSGYIYKGSVVKLTAGDFHNGYYNLTFYYNSENVNIGYNFNDFYYPIMELGLVFLISSFLYMTTRYYKKDIQVMVI